MRRRRGGGKRNRWDRWLFRGVPSRTGSRLYSSCLRIFLSFFFTLLSPAKRTLYILYGALVNSATGGPRVPPDFQLFRAPLSGQKRETLKSTNASQPGALQRKSNKMLRVVVAPCSDHAAEERRSPATPSRFAVASL